MATKKSKSIKFGHKEESMARKILSEYRNHNGESIVIRYEAASRKLFGIAYADLSPGVRSAVSSIAGSSPRKKIVRVVSSLEELWLAEISENKNMQHALLHPEDDAVLIAQLATL